MNTPRKACRHQGGSLMNFNYSEVNSGGFWDCLCSFAQYLKRWSDSMDGCQKLFVGWAAKSVSINHCRTLRHTHTPSLPNTHLYINFLNANYRGGGGLSQGISPPCCVTPCYTCTCAYMLKSSLRSELYAGTCSTLVTLGILKQCLWAHRHIQNSV